MRGTKQSKNARNSQPKQVESRLDQDKLRPDKIGINSIPQSGGVWRTYGVTDGLSDAGVTCLHEDRHGYLWFGTMAGGLYRYDGSEFINYTTEDGLAHNRITWKMCEDQLGRLWIPTWGGVSCFDGKTFVNYTTEDGLPHNRARAICQDREGRLWIVTWGGVSCFDGKGFVTYTTMGINLTSQRNRGEA